MNNILHFGVVHVMLTYLLLADLSELVNIQLHNSLKIKLSLINSQTRLLVAVIDALITECFKMFTTKCRHAVLQDLTRVF
jgi:hypothetical protein